MRRLRKCFRIWSGLSESNRHLNLGKSEANGKSATYEALSGAFSSVWSGQKHLMFLRLFPRKQEYRSGSDVPRDTRVGTLYSERIHGCMRVQASRGLSILFQCGSNATSNVLLVATRSRIDSQLGAQAGADTNPSIRTCF